MSGKVCLFIIDGQVDFCEGGALPVDGATADLQRLAGMVTRFGGDIDDIQLTLDSHYHLHIAHTCMWVDKEGNHPVPVVLRPGNTVPTPITFDDIVAKEWRANNPKFQDRQADYVETLGKNGRYPLLIWPDHCIIGSDGAKIFPELFVAVNGWEEKYFAVAQRTTKGSNMFTEHYSAVMADVEDPEDEKTGLNEKLINTLKEYDKILIAGQALSHCVANTIRDVAAKFDVSQVAKFTLLEDASSSVPGCEQMGQDFVDEMKAKGMEISTTNSFF